MGRRGGVLKPFIVKVEIIKAEYGTGAIPERCHRTPPEAGRGPRVIALPSPSYNESFGDPAPYTVKQLKIKYKLNDKPGEVSFPENASVFLPTPTLPKRFAAVLRGEDKPADNAEHSIRPARL